MAARLAFGLVCNPYRANIGKEACFLSLYFPSHHLMWTTSRIQHTHFINAQDCSTQGLKASLVDMKTFVSKQTFAINYDRDLPQFKTSGGVHKSAGAVVTSPTIMVI